jgi:hypothetical protein
MSPWRDVPHPENVPSLYCGAGGVGGAAGVSTAGGVVADDAESVVDAETGVDSPAGAVEDALADFGVDGAFFVGAFGMAAFAMLAAAKGADAVLETLGAAAFGVFDAVAGAALTPPFEPAIVTPAAAIGGAPGAEDVCTGAAMTRPAAAGDRSGAEVAWAAGRALCGRSAASRRCAAARVLT